MLTFTEKRNLQKQIDVQNKILQSVIGFSDKRNAQKQKILLLSQLMQSKPDVDTVIDVSSDDEVTTKKSTEHLYDFSPDRKMAQRKRENTAAILLLQKVTSGEIDGSKLSEEQKAALAKYSGLGGALVGIDGQKGSDYEYYTPKPIAAGIWELAKALGFSGGKVLDPSAGVGIFGATSPDNALIDAVELDKTSGMVNQLVNGGPGQSVTISPFEKVAAATPDETYDACITNVPFGKNSARGANKMFDKRYQKDSLQSYFILRSIEKIRPGGLAIFIVPPSVTTGRGGKEEKLRVNVSYMAEFLGAYRMPNKVFGTAQADTITDVICFRKYNRETLDKIQELKSQSPQTLIDANVQWQEFINGKYFVGEGRRFMLGEFVPKDPTKYLDPDKVITTASIPEIAAMLRKFPDSRIDWELLNTTETELLIYKEGDIITQAGQTLQYVEDKWVVLGKQEESSELAAGIASYSTPYEAFLNKATYDNALKVRDYMIVTSQALDMPGWFGATMRQLDSRSVEERQKVWNAGIIGMACKQVLNDNMANGNGFNYLEEFPELSEAMARVASSAKANAGKVGGEI